MGLLVEGPTLTGAGVSTNSMHFAGAGILHPSSCFGKQITSHNELGDNSYSSQVSRHLFTRFLPFASLK